MMSIKVKYNDDVDTDQEFYPEDQFSWNVTEYSKHNMIIQMYFAEPQTISSQAGMDELKITFDDTRLIYDFVG